MSIFDTDNPFLGIDLLAPKVRKERKPRKGSETSKPPVPVQAPTKPRRVEIHYGQPRAFIQVMRIQRCQCCEGETHFVGERLVEFDDKRTNIKTWRAQEVVEPAYEKWLETQLPERFHTEISSVEFCATCIYEAYFSQGVEMEPASPFGQLTLWGTQQ